MDPKLPRFTIEYCEQLLRQDPVGCARLYHRIKKETVAMENQVRESEHRWMIRRALIDGPKTAMQASNWSRKAGDPFMDGQLSRTILMNLVKAGEVTVEAMMGGGPDIFRATDDLKRPSEGSAAEKPAPAVATPAEPPAAAAAQPEPPTKCPKCSGPMFPGAKCCRKCYETPAPPAEAPDAKPALRTANEIISLCANDPIGHRRTVNVQTTDIRATAQNVRTGLNTRTATKAWKWSLRVLNDNSLEVAKVAARAEAPPIQLATTQEVQRAAERNEIAPPPQAIIQQPDWTIPPPPGKPWATGRAALAEVDNRIAKLIEMRTALLRVIPLMETGGI